MSTSNRSICHDFFYGGFNKTRCLSSFNVWYQDNFFMSYGTIIGMVVPNKKGEHVLLLSNCNFSQTTSRHISHLYSACPFDVYYVPFEYGNRWDSVDRIANRFKEHLEYYARQKMTQVKNRNAFIEFYRYALQFSEHIQTIDGLEEYRALYDTLRTDEGVKQYKAKEREKASKLRTLAKKNLNDLLKEQDYLSLVKLAYETTGENALKLRQTLNPENNLSFVWRDENGYKTSQGIKLSKLHGDAALEAWKNGALKIGQQISFYKVLKVNENIVKIGCHNIPVGNLKALLA